MVELKQIEHWIVDELRRYLTTAGFVGIEGYPRIGGALFCIGVILARARLYCRKFFTSLDLLYDRYKWCSDNTG